MLRLLLADPDLRAMLSRERVFVHQQGCRIAVAADGEELVRLARQSRPNLIIADADLLRATLQSTLAQLKCSPLLKGTPVFVTAAPRPRVEEQLLEAGADGVLIKPVGKQRLYGILKAAGPAMALDIRVPVGVEVSYLVGSRERKGRVVNVSRGGLYLETDRVSPVGTKLTIELTLPSFTNLARVNGIVTWVNDDSGARTTHLPRGMGVKFVETPLVALRTVALYVLLSKEVVRVT